MFRFWAIFKKTKTQPDLSQSFNLKVKDVLITYDRSDHLFFAVENPAFKDIQDQIPTHESLKDLIIRIQPFWQSTILPSIQSGERVLIVAHGTSLR